MKKYIFEKKDDLGDSLYLQEDGNFTYSQSTAKEFHLKWWEWLFKILLQLVKIYGDGQLKLKK